MHRRSRRALAFAVLVSLVAGARAARSTPPETNEARAARALEAREAGDYAAAIRLLEEAVKAEPRAAWLGLLGETQAWAKRLDDAERTYRAALKRFPGSRDLELGLGRVLAWQGRYPEARRVLSNLVGRNPSDFDALESLALAEYWSGDYRSAARDFRRVLKAHPDRAEARQGLAGIESASASRFEVSADLGSDDQPYRAGRLQTTVSAFSDPLTRWDGAAGSYLLRATGGKAESGTAPFARLGIETVLPSLRLTVTPWIEVLRFADGHTAGLWGVSLRCPLGPSGTVTARAARQELLTVRASIDDHPSATTFGASWDWSPPSRWLARVEASSVRYFDANDGLSLSAFALAPLGSLSGFRLSAGPAVSWQDTSETRFGLASTTSAPLPGGGFRYDYTGAYDPYWTPRRLREARLAAVVRRDLSRNVTAKLQADGGWARDRAVGFGPASGSTAVPPAPFSFVFERGYRPWRVAASLQATFTSGLRLEAVYERRVTVFYASDTLHATLVGHF